MTLLLGPPSSGKTTLMLDLAGKLDPTLGAAATAGQEASVITDYVLKILGLDICADTMVGDQMIRGISGGQKKCVTTVYQGPREHVLEFFECMGFKCPERKGVAGFLHEVTSKKDQKQYWLHKDEPYRFITARECEALSKGDEM